MLKIDNLPVHKPYIEQLIRKKFTEYERLVFKKEFDAGLSGSDVFMIRTIKTTGSEVPSVIKIDRKAQIEQEWKAYNFVIKRCLPGETAIDGKPTFTDDQKYGLLWYPLAGQGSYEIISLLDFLHNSSLENIRSVLSSRLFKNLNTLWKSSRSVFPEFSLSNAYDSYLPPNCIVDIDVPSASTKILPLQEEDFGAENNIKVGEWVKIEGFEVVEIKYDENTLVLNHAKNAKPFKIHAQFKQDADLSRYETGKLLPQPLTGKITETRSGIIKKQIEASLGSLFDTSSATILLPNQKKYPNPLANWRHILNKSFDVYVGSIHGDLNLNNVLIEEESRVVHLIDFSHSRREAYVLRDFFHLEMSLVGTLLAETIWRNQLSPSWVGQFYESLHQIFADDEKEISLREFERPLAIFKLIRHEAKKHLFDPENWSEYYHGLFLCFLGGLKFSPFGNKQLGSLPKQTLGWGMAAILSLIEQSSESEQPNESTQTTDRNEDASLYPTISDNLIEGDENVIGEGNQINASQKSEHPDDIKQKKSNFERNVIKGNRNTIGHGNQINRKK